MGSLKQTTAVTAMNLRGIPQRLGASLVIVITLAGAVTILICVFALATSFAATVNRTGRPDRVIILARGSESEAVSSLSRENVFTLLNSAGIRRNRDSKLIASAEVLTFVRLADRRTGLDTAVTLRGIGKVAGDLRPEIHLVAGRAFMPGLHEVVVGRSAQRRIAGLNVGNRVPLPQGDWTIVGVFESAQDSHESELLTDADTMLSAFQRNTFNSLTLLLDSPDTFDRFEAAVLTQPSLSVDVRREPEYLASLTGPTVKLLKIIAATIGTLMMSGALFAALNAMYTVVSERSTEIATLRAIGYEAVPVVISVLTETLILALAGALLGAAVSWYFFNGSSVNTVPEKIPSAISYSLTIDQRLISLGMLCACGVGLIGGLFPALRAARLDIATVLRK